ncbi:5-carboxymethyl-2-hydroxymuconate isomerase [Pararobbsia alpina]|uniref:hypothetical protein n=1 Tax=Pararobbsia alpina TaxID=621374 RepID=UPI0039A4AA72
MPHIQIEATPEIAKLLDFSAMLKSIHHELDALGYGRRDDFKSRVHITNQALAGDDPQGQFVVARLIMTNPRPASMQRDMARVIHDTLRAGIEAHQPSFWWQCCVLIEMFDASSYFKTDSHMLAAATLAR